VAIYLAANRPIDMLIADRTFGSIDSVLNFLNLDGERLW
jgi:hypothetical protein